MAESPAEAAFTRKTLIAAGIVTAIGTALFVFWTASLAFFLILAGLVLASTFTGIASGLRYVGVPRRVGLLVAYLMLFLLITAGFVWGGVVIVRQFNELVQLVVGQVDRLAGLLQEYGFSNGGPSDEPGLGTLLPSASGLFSSASHAAYAILGGLGNAFVVVFIAIFVSWQPDVYRRGIVSLVPKPRRRRMGETLRNSAHQLTMWLAGQGISMATVFVVSLFGLWAIGMPNAFLLALQAGLLAFVPTLGPFVAGVVIVLAGFADSPQMALYGLIVYVVIQSVESNVTQPMAQRWATALPPALTLGSQLVFGLLFGLIGVALAVPLVAIVKTMVEDLYVKDTLGGYAVDAP